MREHVRLAEEERNSRRTVADAVEIFRVAIDFKKTDRAEIRIGLLRLPSDEIVGLVQLEWVAFEDGTWVVSLPTSKEFRAKRKGALQYETFKIDRLDEAVVDGTRNVTLTDGTSLRAVEVIPAHLPYGSSDLDDRILHHIIAICGAERRCYRHIGDGLPYPIQGIVHNAKIFENLPDPNLIRVRDPLFLDYSTLPGLKIPPLKEIARQIARRDPSLKKLSLQKIADTLRKVGIRIPTARPRRKDCRVAATI